MLAGIGLEHVMKRTSQIAMQVYPRICFYLTKHFFKSSRYFVNQLPADENMQLKYTSSFSLEFCVWIWINQNPANIYLFKVNNGNSKKGAPIVDFVQVNAC